MRSTPDSSPLATRNRRTVLVNADSDSDLVSSSTLSLSPTEDMTLAAIKASSAEFVALAFQTLLAVL